MPSVKEELAPFQELYCCKFLHHIICCYCCCSVTKLCSTLCDPMDCSRTGSSVLGISQARFLEWVAISSSKESSWPRIWTHVPCIGRQILYPWVMWEAPPHNFLPAWKKNKLSVLVWLKVKKRKSQKCITLAKRFLFVCLLVFVCLFFVFNLQSLIHFINLLEEHNGIIGRAHWRDDFHLVLTVNLFTRKCSIIPSSSSYNVEHSKLQACECVYMHLNVNISIYIHIYMHKHTKCILV